VEPPLPESENSSVVLRGSSEGFPKIFQRPSNLSDGQRLSFQTTKGFTMKTNVLSTVAVFAIVVGAAGAAFASEGLIAGQYEIDVPGVGVVVIDVTDTGVEVTTIPEGYEVTLDSDDDDSEFLILDAAGDIALKIEFEGDELEIEGATATPGTHVFTLPDIGTVTVEVAADGSITSVDAPGFTVESDDHGQVRLVSEGGTIEMKLEVEDGVIEFQIEVDDESDAVIDDESDDHDSDDDESDDDHDEDKDHDSDDDDDSHDDDDSDDESHDD
jgi:hypothetical protein